MRKLIELLHTQYLLVLNNHSMNKPTETYHPELSGRQQLGQLSANLVWLRETFTCILYALFQKRQEVMLAPRDSIIGE